jgi:branched-subunit amino acid transport protein
MYVLIVARAFLAALQSPVLLTRRIKRLTIVGKYQLAAISIGVLQYWACVVLSSVFLENVLWGAMGFVVYTIPLTGVAKPATTKWYWYLEGGEVKEEEDEEYARHARRGIISMLAFLTPSLALFLWKSARAMLRAIPELVRFVKEFIATLWRLLCTQALVRSTTTGILGVVIAKFLFVEMMELRAAPTIVLGLLIGGLLGYFLPEPERQIVQQ